ncbi:aldolase [Peribacillus muralis]|uniref:aldolase n=1 Tax=Peribacillus muralis TaxID=264697 RepID=UPI003D055DCB
MRFANIRENNEGRATTKTLLILNNIIFEKYRGAKAGYWYDIPLDFFENFNVLQEAQEYRLIMFKATTCNAQMLDFQQFRSRNEDLFIRFPYHFFPRHFFSHRFFSYINFEDSFFYRYLCHKGPIKNLELIVRDVGCGNWNEVKGDDFFLIYDLGGDIKFTDSDMELIFDKAKINRPFFGIISHWDLDHYRALLDLDDSQLKLMKNIVVPSKMPSTLQLKSALRRLIHLGIKVDIILPSLKIGSRIDLISQGRVNNVELFRSSDGANINQSGIVLTIEGANKIGVLTGDHHYPQIYNAVLNIKSLKPYELVVPHHGGNAGNFDLTLWSSIPFSSGALSTMSGRYRNLPQTKVHNFFVTKKSFHCTECQKKPYTTFL